MPPRLLLPFLMFTPEQQNAIDTTLMGRPGRTHKLDVDGTPVIVKQLEPQLKHWGYPVLDTLAAILGQPMLRAVPAPGGSDAQRIEVMRLQSLKAAGASVPDVLHVTPQWFAMSFLGETSLDHMLREHADIGQRYWETGLNAILALHRLGQTASQCFARNMIWHEGKISFIDFEDDPTKSMPLEAAQARDWVLYLHSTAYILRMTPEHIASVLLRYLRKDKPDVQQHVLRAARTFGWLRVLPNKRKPWGRDVVSAHFAAMALHHLVEEDRRERAIF